MAIELLVHACCRGPSFRLSPSDCSDSLDDCMVPILNMTKLDSNLIRSKVRLIAMISMHQGRHAGTAEGIVRAACYQTSVRRAGSYMCMRLCITHELSNVQSNMSWGSLLLHQTCIFTVVLWCCPGTIVIGSDCSPYPVSSPATMSINI